MMPQGPCPRLEAHAMADQLKLGLIINAGSWREDSNALNCSSTKAHNISMQPDIALHRTCGLSTVRPRTEGKVAICLRA
jgi:hypothetical protein